MPLGIGHDLAIAGMIGSFHGNDAAADGWVSLAQIFGEFCLRAGRANDEDFAGIADGVHHLAKKLLVQPGMTAAYRVGLMVKVSRGQVRCKVTSSSPDSPMWKTLACEWSIQTIAWKWVGMSESF